jgi:DNA-binding transcriptional LysR family regulator
MNIEFNQLRCFVAVAEELHFGRAATRLFMTQPPLSRQVRLLEEALGFRLFERNSRSVRLTDAGRAYYEDAMRILRLADHATDSARRVAQGDAGQVIVGFTAVSGYQLVPAMLAAARTQLPGITVVLREMVSSAQARALEARAIDLGVMRAQYAGQGLTHRQIGKEPLLLALPRTHPMASYRGAVAARELQDQPFVMYSADGGKYFHDRINGLLSASNVRVGFVQFIEQTHSIVALVRAGHGIAIVPASACQLGFRDVVYRPLWTTDAWAELDLVWNSDQTHPAVDRLRIFAIEYFTQLQNSPPSDKTSDLNKQ